ncbi:MAG: adenylate/guanylate cyclase domain-containing protein [Patescibacteria group bacterium]
MNIKGKNTFLCPIVVGATVGLVAAIASLSGALTTWSSFASDRFFLSRPADSSIVIVSIDDSSLATIGRWPWPREVHARIIDALSKAGASAIGYDVNFPEPSDEENDAALESSLRSAGNVVLPVELQLAFSGSALSYDPTVVVSPLPRFSAAARATGHSNTPPDIDGIVRRIPLVAYAPDKSAVSAFALETLRILQPTITAPIKVMDRFGRLLVNFNGPPRHVFTTISASDVLRGNFDAAKVAGKIVFVGSSAADLHDDRLVPTSLGSPMPGVEIHASLADTIRSERWLVPVPKWIEMLLLFAIGLFFGLVVTFLRARNSIAVAVIFWVGLVVTAIVLFDRGRILDIVWPTIAIIFSYVSVTLERRLTSDREKRELKSAFSRYVAPTVVESILQDPSRLKLGGEKRRMTVLFSDVRGFTTISESLPPEQLVEIMNTYLTAMTEIVFANGGTLDKYIGDAVMAFWNAPLDQPDHAIRAATTAIEMQKKLADMNKEKIFPNGIELKIGVGINTGEMIVGNMGSETRFDYTVLGDNVNLGARLESLTKEHGVGIIVSEATRSEVGDALVTRELGTVTVKGKKAPVLIHELLEIKK